MAFCPECKATVDDQADTCEQCGYQFEETKPAAPATSTSEDAPVAVERTQWFREPWTNTILGLSSFLCIAGSALVVFATVLGMFHGNLWMLVTGPMSLLILAGLAIVFARAAEDTEKS